MPRAHKIRSLMTGSRLIQGVAKAVLTVVDFRKKSQDDMHVRVYNYNTLERVHQFEAHSDYIRSIAVHPTQPAFLTSSGVPDSDIPLTTLYAEHSLVIWMIITGFTPLTDFGAVNGIPLQIH